MIAQSDIYAADLQSAFGAQVVIEPQGGKR